DAWDHAERYRSLYRGHAGDTRYLFQLASLDHDAILEAAESRDATLCARRVAAHLARTALMTIARVDPGHDPVRVRAALELVSGEDVMPSIEPPAEGADVKVLGYVRNE